MILSTGVDLAEVGRIRAALEDPRIGQRFRARVVYRKGNRLLRNKAARQIRKLRRPLRRQRGGDEGAWAAAGARRFVGSISKLRAHAAANRKSFCTIRRRSLPSN